MVEMLGVLAIVGVLSVGGISAYGVAMKKHKANELLHQASMLATTISAQAMTNNGTLPSTITSFGNTNYGTFSTNATEAFDGKGFSIEISNMDSAVCEQMENMAGGMVREATCDGTTLTLSYYKNLATDPAEGAKSPTGGSTEDEEVESPDCIEDIEGEINPYIKHGADCTRSNGDDGICHYGKCIEKNPTPYQLLEAEGNYSDAVAACSAISKRLPTLDDFGCMEGLNCSKIDTDLLTVPFWFSNGCDGGYIFMNPSYSQPYCMPSTEEIINIVCVG